jgi:hypothetical protein
MERFEKLILWNDMKSGPKAVPGSYRARLTVGDVVRDEAFAVRPDPRSPASQADFLAQFGFVMECRDLLSRTHREITRIRELKSQLAALQPRFEDSEAGTAGADLLAQMTALEEKVTAIEQALYQTDNES